jgi:sulfoxide reductase heme-binding subunit YedZ
MHAIWPALSLTALPAPRAVAPMLAVALSAVKAAARGPAADDPTLWYVTRAAAISAYVLLTVAVLVGQGRSMVRSSGWRAPGLIWLLDEGHRYIAALAAVFVGLHLVTLLLDPVVPFGLLNLLLPIGEPYRPLPTSLGVFAFYALVAVLLSSWMRRSLSYGFWRALHVLGFGVFVLITLHGIYAGADADAPWMRSIYGIAAGMVTLLVGLRLVVASAGTTSSQPSV